MNPELNKFKRTRSSLETDVLLVGLTLGVVAIVLFVNKTYILSILFFIFLMYILYNYSNIPSSVSVDNTGIQYGKKIFWWEEIDHILFTVNKAGPFIKIRIKNQTFNVFWRQYQNYKELRKLFEDICIEKNIPYDIEDRGSLN